VGLSSSFIFQCNICHETETIHSESPTEKKVNKAAVWGALSTGSTYSHMNEFFSVLDIPPMNGNMFFETQRDLGHVS